MYLIRKFGRPLKHYLHKEEEYRYISQLTTFKIQRIRLNRFFFLKVKEEKEDQNIRISKRRWIQGTKCVFIHMGNVKNYFKMREEIQKICMNINDDYVNLQLKQFGKEQGTFFAKRCTIHSNNITKENK